MATIIRLRLGGIMVVTSSAFRFIPHFMVMKEGRYIDFICRNYNEPKTHQLWFEGKLRRRKIRFHKKPVIPLF